MDANINDKAKVLFPNIKGIFKKSQTDNGIVQEQQVQNNLENKQDELQFDVNEYQKEINKLVNGENNIYKYLLLDWLHILMYNQKQFGLIR